MAELLQTKAEVQGKLDLMAAELADLTARQAAAEPELKRIAAMILKNLDAQEKLRQAPGALILGGILGLGYKPAVKQQLEHLSAECKTLEADLQRKSDEWNLGGIYYFHIDPQCRRPYCPSRPRRQRRSIDTAPSRTHPLRTHPLLVEGISSLFMEQKTRIQQKHDRWNLEREIELVTQELNKRASIEAENQREANRIARDNLKRAKIAAHDNKSRELTTTVKKTLPPQADCPYCGDRLGDDPHADHIYPINKGGHSVPENMVLVCAACNLKKGTKTLRAFILQYDLNRDDIERRLSELGKDF